MEKELEISRREIRGITAKTIMWFMGGIISVIITVMGTYFSLLRKMDTINVIQTNVNVINARVDNDEQDIRDIKQNMLPGLKSRVSAIEQQLKDETELKPSK